MAVFVPGPCLVAVLVSGLVQPPFQAGAWGLAPWGENSSVPAACASDPCIPWAHLPLLFLPELHLA